MILSLPHDTALENYVQASGMAASTWVDGESGECDCGGPPPPSFMLPPPPRPPPPYDLLDPYHAAGDCEDPFTCPSLLGAREDQRPGPPRAPIAVVVVSAATLVVLVVVAAVIVCRLRGRGRAPKGCTELSGAIIYDDLPSAPSIVPARSRPRFKPVPVDGEEMMMGMTMGVHLYTPEPRSNPPSEHLYQSISSGSETCSYSTSEAAGQDGRALLRGPRYPPRHRGAALTDTDSEEEPLAALAALGEPSDTDTPSPSPAHVRYYCPSAPPPARSPGPDYESVYYVGGVRRGRGRGRGRGRPSTPQQRGLPPLPSRTDRFRTYFSVERGQHRRHHHRRHAPERRHNLHHSHPPEAEPLYENLT